MTDQELAAILTNHERLFRQDQAILDAVYSNNTLLSIGIGIGIVIFLTQLFTIVSKWWIWRDNQVTADKQEALLRETLQYKKDAHDLLVLVKDWAETGRASRKEVTQVVKTLTEGPSREAIVKAVESVPERTAELVVKKTKNGDSGHHKAIPPAEAPP